MIPEFQGQYRWLSNFWNIFPGIEYMGKSFSTIEKAYQYAKANTQDGRDYIYKALTPGDAKRRGKIVEIRHDWDSVKVGIMLELVRLKFKNPNLRKLLLETGDQYLQEGNKWHDKFWGVDLRTGKGENNLGQILMQVRSEIKGGE